MQMLPEHTVLEQSAPAPLSHGSPATRVQTPLLHVPDAQSLLVMQGAHTWDWQRLLPQVTSEKQGSPAASLQRPLAQTPLKQGADAEHVSPRWPSEVMEQAWSTSQVTLIMQKFTASSAPLGRS